MVAPHSEVTDPLARLKAAARHAALIRRAICDPTLGTQLAERLLAEAPPATGAVVAGFWPMGQEIDTRPLLRALASRGHPLVLPVTPKRGHPLRFRRWSFGAPLAAGPMGTRHPAEGEDLPPDWLLVPLLAFDRAGRRLGYGGGYYDRTLAMLPQAVAMGCGYAAQEAPEVPAGPLDFRLRQVATEQGVIACGA